MSAGRRPRRHAADAGGDPAVLEAKQVLREAVWDTLQQQGVARFPGAHGRIPNFDGATEAADRLADLKLWFRLRVLKANPDSPQRPVRQRALEDGVAVFMAVPRLADRRPFVRLDPAELPVSPREAASIKGATRHGRPVPVEHLQPVGLVVVGSVAVDDDGARLGKGGGFADLEFALAVEAGLIGHDTVVATTVHPCQLLPSGRIPLVEHDVPVDVIVTPQEVRWCARAPRPAGIRWSELTEEKIAAIPLLARLRQAGTP